MTPKGRQQAYLLGGLVVALALVVFMRQPSAPDSAGAAAPQAGTGAQSSNQASRGTARQETLVTDVRLEALTGADAPLTGSDRNPFRFRPKALPPAPRVVTPPPQTFVPPPVVGPPPPPPIPLRYVGYLGAAPQLTAIFSDARGTPFYGKEGDIIEGRYRVLRIAADSVDIAYADGRGRQTFRLSSQ